MNAIGKSKAAGSGISSNPLTGWPAEGLSSVTVGAQSCGAAGLYSTIAILKGEAGPQSLREKHVAHLFVDAVRAARLERHRKTGRYPPAR